MVPPDAFSTAAPHSSSDFCKGCDAGTQCDSFSSKVFSCAKAAVVLTASSKASRAFLIGLPPRKKAAFAQPSLFNMLSRAHLAFKARGLPGPHVQRAFQRALADRYTV